MNEPELNEKLKRCIEPECIEFRHRDKRCLAHQRKYEREAQRKHRIKVGTGIVPPGDPNIYSGQISVLTFEPDAICTGCGIKLKEALWTVGRHCDVCRSKQVIYATKVRLEQLRAIAVKCARKLSKSEVGRLGGLAKAQNFKNRQEQQDV